MDLSLNFTFHSFHYPSKLTTEYFHTPRSNLLYLNIYRHKRSNFLITRTTYTKFKVTGKIPRCSTAKSTVFDRKFKYETKKNRVIPKRQIPSFVVHFSHRFTGNSLPGARESDISWFSDPLTPSIRRHEFGTVARYVITSVTICVQGSRASTQTRSKLCRTLRRNSPCLLCSNCSVCVRNTMQNANRRKGFVHGSMPAT